VGGGGQAEAYGPRSVLGSANQSYIVLAQLIASIYLVRILYTVPGEASTLQ